MTDTHAQIAAELGLEFYEVHGPLYRFAVGPSFVSPMTCFTARERDALIEHAAAEWLRERDHVVVMGVAWMMNETAACYGDWLLLHATDYPAALLEAIKRVKASQTEPG